MTETILDEAEKSVRVQNWYSILENNSELVRILQDDDEAATELAQSEAATRVINFLNLP
jgi:hypothetical protein